MERKIWCATKELSEGSSWMHTQEDIITYIRLVYHVSQRVSVVFSSCESVVFLRFS